MRLECNIANQLKFCIKKNISSLLLTYLSQNQEWTGHRDYLVNLQRAAALVDRE